MSIPEDLNMLAEDIISFRRERKQYVKKLADDVAEMLTTYDKEMEALAKDLKEFLSKSETARKESFKEMITTIQVKIEDIRKETANLRTRFVKEHEEMAADLKKFLSKSETARKEEFAAMWKDVTDRVQAIREETKDLVAHLRKENEELASEVKELLAKVDRDMKKAKAAWAKVYGGAGASVKVKKE